MGAALFVRQKNVFLLAKVSLFQDRYVGWVGLMVSVKCSMKMVGDRDSRGEACGVEELLALMERIRW